MELLEAVRAIFDVCYWGPLHHRTWGVWRHALPLVPENMRLIIIALLTHGGLLTRLTPIIKQVVDRISFAWGIMATLIRLFLMVHKYKPFMLRQITLGNFCRLDWSFLHLSFGVSVNGVWIRSNVRCRVTLRIVLRIWIVWHIIIRLTVAHVILCALSLLHFNILYILSNIIYIL